MHLLIPYAASHAQACQAALATLQLPRLQKLLPHLTAQPLDAADELSLSPPHERALAKWLGLPNADGQIPWAAWQVQQQPGLAFLGGAWSFVTLCNWQANMKEVTMHQMPMHDLSAAESDTLLSAMQPYFAEDGITLYPYEPGCWLARGEVFAALPTASPDRVQGRDLTPWMPSLTHAGHLIRLVSEMQMLLYTHPVNDARSARGVLPVNAFWLHGSGAWVAQQASQDDSDPVGRTPPTVVSSLRDTALRDDWPAWAAAWRAIDAEQGPALLAAHAQGEPIQLTLCGERNAQTWQNQPQALMQKIKCFFGTQPILNVLNKL